VFYSPPFSFLSSSHLAPLFHRACSLAFPTSVMKGTRELEKGLVVPYRCGTTHAHTSMFIYVARSSCQRLHI
jgi:hypothetical protein